MFRAVILAGGSGTRLRPITDTLPKPMLPVLGEPNLCRIADLLCRNGFNNAVVTVRYMAEKITGVLGDSCRGVDLYYSEEEIPLGTAGAVKAVSHLLSADFLVISGDAVCGLDLSEAYGFHMRSGAAVTVITHKVKDPRQFGTVISDASGRIVSFREKPGWGQVTSDKVNTGIYIMSKRVTEYVDKTPCDFSLDVFPKLLEKGEKMCAFEADGYWRDIGSFSDYLQCNMDLLDISGKEDDPRHSVCGEDLRTGENSTFINSVAFDNVSIGSNCSVTGSILCKNVIIGDGCVIRDGCVIGEGAVVCDGVKLGAGTVIQTGKTVTENKNGIMVRKKLFENGRIGFEKSAEGYAEICKLASAVAAALNGTVGVCFEKDSGGACRYPAELFARALCGAGGNVYEFGETEIFAAASAGVYFDNEITVFCKNSGKADGKITFCFFDKTGMSLCANIEKDITKAYYSDEKDGRTPGALRVMGGLDRLYYSALSSSCSLEGVSVYVVYGKGSADVSAALEAAKAKTVASDDLYKERGAFVLNKNDGASLLGQNGKFCSFDECLLILLGIIDPAAAPKIALPFFLPRIYEETAVSRGIEVIRYLSKPSFGQKSDTEARKLRSACEWTYDPAFCAARLMSELHRNGLTLSEAFDRYCGVYLGRDRISVADSEKASVLRRLYEAYLPYQISAADGIAFCEAGAEGMVAADDSDTLKLFISAESTEAASDAVSEILQRIGKSRS